MALVSLQNINLSVAGIALLENAALSVESGERVCLVGRNGAGKSTLLRVLSGEIKPDSGEVIVQKGARIAALPQEVPENIEGKVFDVISAGLAPEDQDEEHRVQSIITRLDLDGEQNFSDLSGGLKRRTLLARALAGNPDLLLLDEPTNHLDIASIAWLEDFLLRANCALLFVTHDRAFLKKLATRIVEIDRGKLSSWACSYEQYLERKEAALEAEAKQNEIFDRKMAQEEVWIRKGVKARTTRNEGRVRALKKMREERKARREVSGALQFDLQEAGKSGRLVADVKDVSFAYDEKPIVRNFSTVVMRGDKIGIIGPNGTGKTTLLKLLLGELKPQSGQLKLGTNLQIAYSDQMRGALDDNLSVQQNIAGENDTVNVGGTRRHVIGYLQEFGFEPQRARTPVRVLSGGERNRVLLAKLWTQPSNILVLDEPTNDLDIETLDLLEELLINYSGTVLLVSHDRDFLDNVVSSTLSPLEAGTWREYIGGYTDYERQSRAERELLEAKQKPKTEAPKPKNQKERARRISFNEKRELESLPALIEKLEAEHEELIAKLSDPDFYKDHAAQAAQMHERVQQIETERDKAFARWEELEAIAANEK